MGVATDARPTTDFSKIRHGACPYEAHTDHCGCTYPQRDFYLTRVPYPLYYGGIGIGNIFGSFVSAAIRNPAAAPRVFGNVLLGFALTEAIALFALVIALLLLFAF